MYKDLVGSGITSTHTQTHIVHSQRVCQWDRFPAWGVGLAVVRSGPILKGKETYQAERLESEKASVRNRDRKNKHADSHIDCTAFISRTETTKKT